MLFTATELRTQCTCTVAAATAKGNEMLVSKVLVHTALAGKKGMRCGNPSLKIIYSEESQQNHRGQKVTGIVLTLGAQQVQLAHTYTLHYTTLSPAITS